MQKVLKDNGEFLYGGECYLLSSNVLLCMYSNFFKQKEIKRLEIPDIEKLVKNISKYSIFYKKITNFYCAFLPIIFTLDNGDDWQDEKNWKKANPALGLSKSIKFMRDAYALAQHSPRAVNEFKTKQLDLWSNEISAWLSVDAWRDLTRQIDDKELLGKRCIVGMDLGETNDLVAFAFLFPPFGT